MWHFFQHFFELCQFLIAPSKPQELSTGLVGATPLRASGTTVKSARKALVFDDPSKHIEASNECPLPNATIDSLTRAIYTGYISSIASGIEAHCPELYSELVKRWLESKRPKFQKLCKRNGNGSILFNKSFESMENFEMNKVWDELLEHHPFLIDVMNVASKVSCEASKTPARNRIRYCFIYSILMNLRWHELSLMQRVNTVLMIEGGGTARVSLFSNYFRSGFLYLIFLPQHDFFPIPKAVQNLWCTTPLLTR